MIRYVDIFCETFINSNHFKYVWSVAGRDQSIKQTKLTTLDKSSMVQKRINVELIYFLKLCPAWSSWSNYTDCSVSCGNGTQIRGKTCLNGNVEDIGCDQGRISDIQMCNDQVSWPLKVSIPPQLYANFFEILKALLLSITCRVIFDILIEIFQLCPSWGTWGPWEECSQSITDGLITRYRTCENGKISHIGCPSGDELETKSCNFGVRAKSDVDQTAFPLYYSA